MQSETTLATEMDLPPEYCHYRDEGCDLAQSCLNCPFPRCVYEIPRGRQHLLKGRRNQQILSQYHNEGKGVKELATAFGISQRTIQRVLKEDRRQQLTAELG